MIEKRAYERIPVNIHANIVYNDEMYLCTITNVSENGAYIETGSRYPYKLKYEIFFRIKPKFIIFVRSNGDSLKLLVKTRRWCKIDRSCNGIGVEVLYPSQDYHRLINSH